MPNSNFYFRCLFPALLAGILQFRQEPAGSRPARATPGDFVMEMRHNGQDRRWILHVPKGHDGAASRPLVVMLHGGFGSARQASEQYGWREKSDAEGFFVAFPDGTGAVQTWNAGHCCGAALRNNIDDTGFIKNMVRELVQQYGVDESRVYATGMSNGGMLTHRLAAELSDVFAAVAPVAGAIGGRESATASWIQIPPPKTPVPIMIIHGKLDKNVCYDGGPTQVGAVTGRVDASVADATKLWIQANRCDSRPARENNKSGNVNIERYTPGARGAEVVVVTVLDQGHAWPGGRRGARFLDAPVESWNATDEIWKFFSKFTRRAPRGV